MHQFSEKELHTNREYLELLSKDFPNISIASAEAINLTAILNLPKGTEHFLTDLHGEADAFHHVLQNASGVVKRKINDVFKDTLGPSDIAALASLIYYPELHLRARKKAGENSLDWQKSTIYQLVKICRDASSKYTRSKVRKALPGDYAYVIEELLHEDEERFNKKAYYYQIIDAIVDLDRGESFIKALCSVIKRLTIDHLHILGDVYDRGSGPHHIMEQLRKHHSLDIQWGNHDILWMGAAAGNQTCIANAVRISLRYSNLDVLEDGYGINLLPLATFAMKVYGNKAADSFRPKAGSGESSFDGDRTMITAMHQAITVIQLKLEHQIIQRHPEWHMQNRLFLHHINPDNGILSINGSEIPLTTDFFPTYNPDKPEQLTDEEEYVIEKLVSSFAVSEKLQQHVQFLYSKGSIYLTYNNNLLFHACIPMTEDGEFKKVTLYGKTLAGKALLDQMDQWARESFFKKDLAAPTHDFLWFLWCHNDSPLFGKDKMATFERYFLKDETTHEEQYAPYYHLIEREDVAKKILHAFGLDPQTSHIINGHVPVKTQEGESPIKANGRLLVIDGGFAKSYQKTTGIAGYTLIYNSYGLQLVSHEPFENIDKALSTEKDIRSTSFVVEQALERQKVSHTDIGGKLKKQIYFLEMLITAYRKGLLQETSTP